VGINRVEVLEHGMLRAVESMEAYEVELMASQRRFQQRQETIV
jgi:hypothetical protein